MADGDPGALDAFRALERAQPDDALVGFHRGRLEDGLCGSVVDLSSHRERRTRSDREAAVPAALEQ